MYMKKLFQVEEEVLKQLELEVAEEEMSVRQYLMIKVSIL